MIVWTFRDILTALGLGLALIFVVIAAIFYLIGYIADKHLEELKTKKGEK